jgi:hypothetical protein
MLVASSLDIYTDKSFYTYQPKDNFIGFNTVIKAKNSLGSLELIKKNSCSENNNLCTEHTNLQALHVRLNQLTKEQSILDTLVSQYSPDTSIDADSTIKTASKIASRMATIAQESKNLQKEIQNASSQFIKHAPSKEALFYSQKPQSEVTLTINRGLYFQSEYLLDIDSGNLEHSLLLSNRSGVDIVADEVKLFAKPAGYISAPTRFYPRKIRIAQPQAKRSAMRKEMTMMAVAEMDTVAAAPAPVANKSLHVSKTETRSYRLKNLTLPSDGKEKKIPVDIEKLHIDSYLTWHPYNSSNVYKTASFIPKQTIESRQWKVRYNQQLIENAPIRKDAKEILINVAIDYDIETKRKTIYEFSEDKGIFSSDRLKKEGFTLTLANRSKVDKKVKITERIPLSTQEEIQVSLEKLDLPYEYDKKTGKLTITASIKAGKTLTTDVIYVIRYPKETEIYY